LSSPVDTARVVNARLTFRFHFVPPAVPSACRPRYAMRGMRRQRATFGLARVCTTTVSKTVSGGFPPTRVRILPLRFRAGFGLFAGWPSGTNDCPPQQSRRLRRALPRDLPRPRRVDRRHRRAAQRLIAKSARAARSPQAPMTGHRLGLSLSYAAAPGVALGTGGGDRSAFALGRSLEHRRLRRGRVRPGRRSRLRGLGGRWRPLRTCRLG
jgi:hypothetical protein